MFRAHSCAPFVLSKKFCSAAQQAAGEGSAPPGAPRLGFVVVFGLFHGGWRRRFDGRFGLVGGVSARSISVGGVSARSISVGGISVKSISLGGVSARSVSLGGVSARSISVGGVSVDQGQLFDHGLLFVRGVGRRFGCFLDLRGCRPKRVDGWSQVGPRAQAGDQHTADEFISAVEIEGAALPSATVLAPGTDRAAE